MDFVAIDFETATSKSTSVCSLGICVVEDNVITDKQEILIRPEPLEFNDYNIRIHGITPSMVEKKPTFEAYWNFVHPYLENKLVVAHNAMFDVGALRATLEQFQIEYPTFDYLCTVKLSQLAYPELKSHKLNNLCDALGVHFKHHHAKDDAYACAEVLLHIMDDYSLDSVDDVIECFDEIELGHLYPGCHTPCSKRKKRSHRKKQYSVSDTPRIQETPKIAVMHS